MISVIAHQWRQPLNNISTIIQTISLKYSRNLLNKIFMKNAQQDMLDQISYMSNTIDDFRNFYKPNQTKSKFNIKQELVKVLDLIYTPYRQDRIKLDKLQMDDFIIQGYPNELAQCFLIILNNARDALLENSTRANKTISISLRAVEKSCVITFEDNGGGIPKNIIKKIFSPYFSTKHNKQGTGLGLYTARLIIKKYSKGNIQASNTNLGAKFEIRLEK